MTPPVRPAVPRVVLDGDVVPELGRELTSFSVHVLDGRATAEIEVRGSPQQLPSTRAGVDAAAVSIWLSADEQCFSGSLTDVEIRMGPGAGLTTALIAAGTSPDGAPLPALPLRFGAEIEVGSVRRGGDVVTARCTTSALGLRRRRRIILTTPEPAFDGEFEVAELRYRFGTPGGLSIEFVATA